MLAQRHHIVHAAVDDIVVLLWSACTGTLKFLFSLFFLLPTHVLFILGIAFVWMLVRDSIVYVSLEFGRILDDMLLPVQVHTFVLSTACVSHSRSVGY